MRGTITSTKAERDGFGLRLTQAREACCMTQQELAQACGLRYDTSIGNYETGRALPSLPVYVKICRVLGISLDDLVRGNEIWAKA